MTRIVKHLFLVILLLVGAQYSGAQQVAVKTNGLMLLTGLPNLGCEFVTGEHTSVDMTLFGGYKPYGKNIKIIGVQPELRYWFNGRPMVREYLGIAALGTTYDIQWGENIYKGDAFGLGVTMGYSLILNKRWNVEFYAGFGAVYFRQKQYYTHDNFEDYEANNVGKANAYGYKLLPTKLGVSISYIIK